MYNGSLWVDAASAVNGTVERQSYTATAGQTTFSVTYDVGFVDIWLNGIKLLDGTDFTATNGTSIVLTTGASVGDLVDIIAFGTFALANHYTKTEVDTLLGSASSTPSIDDNGNATALTIDSDENVGIGTSSPSTPLSLHSALSSGGAIAEFRSTGNASSTLDIRADGTGDSRIWFDLNGATPFAIGVDNSDGDKFKISGSSQLGTNDRLTIDSSGDVTLSGGVYLGGTGSANYLDSYEEGTWTPTASSGGSFSSNSAFGSYTKIGNVVTLHATFIVASNSSGAGFGIGGIPFNQSNQANAAAGFYMRYTNDSTYRMFYLSSNIISVYDLGGSATTFGQVSGKRFDFSGVYYTDA